LIGALAPRSECAFDPAVRLDDAVYGALQSKIALAACEGADALAMMTP
jgi:hypothetical protein